MTVTVGVLALQGAFLEHITLLKRAALYIKEEIDDLRTEFIFIEVRNSSHLSLCDALIIPGGESTTISLVAAQSGLLEPLRDFVKVDRKPTWGTCAGLILLAEAANQTKKGGQELIGGLDVRVNRNHFGRQVESFEADLDLPFLTTSEAANVPFPGVFIRAPVVEEILPTVRGAQTDEQLMEATVVAPSKPVKGAKTEKGAAREIEIMGVLPGRLKKAKDFGVSVAGSEEAGDVVAVRQGNVFGTSFHPELTADIRIHVWWLQSITETMADI